jgi:hypothetical protein
VIQLVLHLHECANPAAAEPLHFIADSTIAESAGESLQSIPNSPAIGAAPIETS